MSHLTTDEFGHHYLIVEGARYKVCPTVAKYIESLEEKTAHEFYESQGDELPEAV